MRGRPPQPKKEKPKRIYDSFKEVERLALKFEQGGELLILLKCNEVRVFKLEYYLNGDLLRPENIQGKNLAYKRWAELIGKLVESGRENPLTPDIKE